VPGEPVSPVSNVQRVAVGCCLLVLAGHRVDAAFGIAPVLPLISDICDTCPAPQVRLPIAFTGLKADSKVTVALRGAALGNRPDTQYREAIVPALVQADTGFELQISIKPNSLREAGTYAVALEFSVAGEEPQRTTLQLVRTAAAMQPLGTLIVERVLATPWSQAKGNGPPLMMLETSRRTGLTGIDVVPPNPLGAEYVSVKLPPRDCENQSATAPKAGDKPLNDFQVGPGRSRCLEYESVGAFPWGALVQAYSLRSPELAAPVAVTFDVRTRLHRAYVLAYIVLGVIAAFIVKVFLQRRIDQGTARGLAFELEETVRADLAKHPDAVFRAALERPLKELADKVAAGAVEAITTARTALDIAWRAALTDLATNRAAAQQMIDRLQTIAETDWDVPAALKATIASVRDDTAKSRELLASGRVSAAKDAAAAAVTRAGGAMTTAIQTWQDNVSDVLTVIPASPLGLSPATATVATTAVSEAKLRIGSTKLSPIATAEQIIAALVGLADEVRAARKVARVVVLAIEQELDRIAATFGRTREQLAEVVAAVTALRPALLDGIDRPERGQELARTALAAVDKAWRAEFENIGGQPLPTPVSDLLDQKRYDEAAIALVKALRGEADAAAMRAQRALLPTVAADDPVSPVRNFETRVEATAAPPPLAALRARTRMEVARAKLLQTALVTLLAGLIGYSLFAPKFIGDFQDFVIIFFWAFGLDLSADAVARLAPTARR
jgi:hypothetical protein